MVRSLLERILRELVIGPSGQDEVTESAAPDLCAGETSKGHVAKCPYEGPPKCACDFPKGIYLTEASLQHAIAIKLAQAGLCPALEAPAPEGRQTDIIIAEGGSCWGIEIKYKTRERVKGSCYFRSQRAVNNGGYDFLADIKRLEKWKSSGWIDNGCAVFVTNDHLYWHPARQGAKSEDFRFPDGKEIHGEYLAAWKGRDTHGVIDINGTYPVRWLTGLNPCCFRALMIFV